MVNQLSSFRYVEVDGEVHETHFQAFEILNVIMTHLSKEPKKIELSITSWKEAKTVVEAGHPEG